MTLFNLHCQFDHGLGNIAIFRTCWISLVGPPRPTPTSRISETSVPQLQPPSRYTHVGGSLTDGLHNARLFDRCVCGSRGWQVEMHTDRMPDFRGTVLMAKTRHMRKFYGRQGCLHEEPILEVIWFRRATRKGPPRAVRCFVHRCRSHQDLPGCNHPCSSSSMLSPSLLFRFSSPPTVQAMCAAILESLSAHYW
jgi:hypothetical protein